MEKWNVKNVNSIISIISWRAFTQSLELIGLTLSLRLRWALHYARVMGKLGQILALGFVFIFKHMPIVTELSVNIQPTNESC